MKPKPFLLLLIPLIILQFGGSSWACSTFVLKTGGRQVFGRNYDWHMGDALLMVNNRGCRKRSITRPEELGAKATWVARYGSITFNQYGRELPTGGMNEAGLVVEAMALSKTRYAEPDHRPYVGLALQWRQYLLDTCGTVAEVIEADRKIRISDKAPGLGMHVLVLDKTGDCAVIEFLDGRMQVHTGNGLPVAVSTNDTYAESLQYLRENHPPIYDHGQSIARFITAAKMNRRCQAATSDQLISYAFETLAAVSSTRTQWQIVYDNLNMTVAFRTYAHPQIRHINVLDFDFSRATPVKILDVNADLHGNVIGHFSDYTYAVNRDQIGRAYLTSGISDARLDALARFPESFECLE
jgi:penicillin V acylase-like amidase (Ntn superfamily)